MAVTVIQHVLSRLWSLGIDAIFGVPGDYAFPVNDAICDDTNIRWIGCCNELNAGYAADGYARIKGVAALSTTYGVGELSAINAIAGSYAEHLPIFHLVGMPDTAIQLARLPIHHTLGNGEFDLFRRMSEPVVCAQAVLTPQNAAYETERLIAEALYHRRPVYMGFPGDLAEQPILGKAEPIIIPNSEPKALAAATEAILEALGKANTKCILPGIIVARLKLQVILQKLIDASGIPFATMFMDKSVLDENQPAYIGMYEGSLMNKEVRDFVENCDRILSVGTLMSDYNTGAFTAHIDPAKEIKIGHHMTRVNGKVFMNVEMSDILNALASQLPKYNRTDKLKVQSSDTQISKDGNSITAETLYPCWANFLKENDILITETGTAAFGLSSALMPKGASFYNQSLWGSIGWATPAAFGAAVAAPNRRVVLITGEGSHQLTAQEISQFARYKLKPIVFVLNNSGYLIERLLCKDPQKAYNDVAPWRYSELPHALGCDGWFTARVSTSEELDQALQRAEQSTTGAYIEVLTDTYAASQLANEIHKHVETLYSR
jgi:indolepyruvate decarboxylase